MGKTFKGASTLFGLTLFAGTVGFLISVFVR